MSSSFQNYVLYISLTHVAFIFLGLCTQKKRDRTRRHCSRIFGRQMEMERRRRRVWWSSGLKAQILRYFTCPTADQADRINQTRPYLYCTDTFSPQMISICIPAYIIVSNYIPVALSILPQFFFCIKFPLYGPQWNSPVPCPQISTQMILKYAQNGLWGAHLFLPSQSYPRAVWSPRRRLLYYVSYSYLSLFHFTPIPVIYSPFDLSLRYRMARLHFIPFLVLLYIFFTLRTEYPQSLPPYPTEGEFYHCLRVLPFTYLLLL